MAFLFTPPSQVLLDLTTQPYGLLLINELHVLAQFALAAWVKVVWQQIGEPAALFYLVILPWRLSLDPVNFCFLGRPRIAVAFHSFMTGMVSFLVWGMCIRFPIRGPLLALF